jgi:pilus assembly protein CpaB
MKPVKLQVNRNLVFLLVALVLGVLAAFLAVNYVQNTISARTTVVEDTIVVGVPKRDMAAGELLGPDDLAARPVPPDLAPADAITPDNYALNVGRLLRAPIRQGAPVSAAALVPLYEQFSAVIAKGNVAYNLSVDENNSISGMIIPGDFVDILLTVDDEDNGARVMPLLENIGVLATGTRVGETPIDDSTTGYGSITLEVSPESAQRLAVAAKSGSLRVILRQIDDRRPFMLNGLTRKQLLSPHQVDEQSGVQYIFGGKN